MKKISLFLLIQLLPLNLIYSQSDRWELGRYMTTPVAEGELVFYQTNLYLIGGYSESRQATLNTIQSYDVTNDIWQDFGEMVTPRRSFVSIATGGKLYMIGGIFNAAAPDAAEEFSLLELTGQNIFWNSSFNRINAQGVLFSGDLYVLGGNPENIDPSINYPYIFKYNLQEVGGEVTILENEAFAYRKLPEQQMVGIYQGNIYIFGGVFNGVSKDIYKYSIHDDLLSKLDIQLLEPRAAGKAIRLIEEYRENIFIIVGGYNESNDALNSMEYFEIMEDNSYRVWSGPSLNIARKNFMIEQQNNKIYVMGGYNDRGNVLSSIEIFEPGLSDREEEPNIPENAVLEQNYPNPFNPSTEISYSISEYTHVSLDIYSISGEHICCLSSGNFTPGRYSVTWHSANDRGQAVPSGIYFSVLNTGEQKQIKKMVLLK